MPATISIPLTFTTDDPARLRADLERFAQAVDLYTRGAAELFAPRLKAIAQLNPTSLSFGMVGRVNLIDGDTLNIALPRANAKDIGRRCGVLRASGTGIVVLHAAVGTVAGATTLGALQARVNQVAETCPPE